MSNRIEELDLERIIQEALQYGIRAGEMRVMGNGNWREFIDEARRTVMTNAKSILLERAREFEERNSFLKGHQEF